MNGQRGADAEHFREAKVIIGEARIGTVLVEGRDDADGLVVEDERDDERRQATNPPRTDLVDLRIFQK
jgi:hypothetical protein